MTVKKETGIEDVDENSVSSSISSLLSIDPGAATDQPPQTAATLLTSQSQAQSMSRIIITSRQESAKF